MYTQVERSQENISKSVIQWKKKRKGTSIGKTMRKSEAVSLISDLFIEQHMGNYITAKKIAEIRAGTIPGSCHIISIDDLSKIKAEMKSREDKKYHDVEENKVINPSTGRRQFKTDKSYRIFEFRYDNKNRVKKGREIISKFYYDAIPNGEGGFILHHFDGIA